MARQLVVASRNKKKVAELVRILADLPYKVESLEAYPDMPETEETGATFLDNARTKALEAARFTGHLALADDSGLEVSALNGAPGVLSARYAGNGGRGSDAANNALLLERLATVPTGERGARFVCAIAIANSSGIVWEGEGIVAGWIGTELRGGPDSFGYDPLFFPEGSALSFAEMDPQAKDQLSHRGKALDMAKVFLQHLTYEGEA